MQALILALHKEGRLNVQAAAELAPRLISSLQRHRVMLMPQALINSPESQGFDPFEIVGEMLQAIEASGRTPWLPEA